MYEKKKKILRTTSPEHFIFQYLYIVKSMIIPFVIKSSAVFYDNIIEYSFQKININIPQYCRSVPDTLD